MRFKPFLLISAAVLSVVLIFRFSDLSQSLTVASATPAAKIETPTSGAMPTKNDLAELPSLPQNKRDFTLHAGLIEIFDSIILDTNSQSITQLTLAAKGYCDSQLLSAVATQSFISLFTRYVEYKLALATVEMDTINHTNTYAEIEYRLQRLHNLKYEYFSDAEIVALFGFDLQLEQSALQRYQIAHDLTLDTDQKQALMRNHFESLPEPERQAFAPSLLIRTLQEIADSADSKPHKLAQIRAEFGHQAADRVQHNWQKQEQFETKLRSLHKEYQTIPEDRQLSWLNQYFSLNQAKRARVLLSQTH